MLRLAVVELIGLVDRLAGDVQAQPLEHVLVHPRQNDRSVELAVSQLFQLLQSQSGIGVGDSADGQGDEGFIGVQAGVAVAHMGNLQILDRLDDLAAEKLHFLFNACQRLQSVHQASGACAQKVRGAACDQRAVGQLDGYGGELTFLCAGNGCCNDRPLQQGNIAAGHEHFQLVHIFSVAHALALGAKVKKHKYGHRGSNQPVKCIADGKVYISTQNHGYVVMNDTVQEGVVSFINVNDGSCEGIEYEALKAITVQFTPDCCEIGNAENPIYAKFFAMMEKEKENA